MSDTAIELAEMNGYLLCLRDIYEATIISRQPLCKALIDQLNDEAERKLKTIIERAKDGN